MAKRSSYKLLIKHSAFTHVRTRLEKQLISPVGRLVFQEK
jgi:hypothetical protein